MASITKVGTGWRARYRTPDGASRSRTFERRVDAEQFLTTVEASKLGGAYIDQAAGRVTLAEWWARYQTMTNKRVTTTSRDNSVM